jgi:hypothetical protein
MAPDNKTPRPKDDINGWFTVSNRTLWLTGGGLALILGAGVYYYMTLATPTTSTSVTAPPSTFGARFNAIEGNVQVRRAGTLEWKNADRGILLTKDDRVRTGSGGSAEMRFTDGTFFHLGPETLFTIVESSEDAASRARQLALTIESGEGTFQTPQRGVPGSATTISTPTVRATAGDDAAGNIAVADSGETGIKLFRGNVAAETKTGQKVQLAPNEAVRVNAEGTPGPKIVLPGIPVLLAPSHQTEIAYVDPAHTSTLFAWKAVPGAVAYHVQLDLNPSFTRLLADRKDWRTGTYMELPGLDVGTYYWRVAAVNKDGVEGGFSDVARFVVTRSQAGAARLSQPPLTIETLEARGNVLQVKGKTEPGASLTVNGQRIDVATSGSFNEYITLEVGAKPVVVIRVTGVNGAVTVQTRPIVISY